MVPNTCDGFEFTSRDAQHTHQIGRALGSCLQPGDVICLSGTLGAGKTALTQGIAAAWGALEAVTSPTFTLVHEHRRAHDDGVLYHVDCYRLSGARDAWGIGLDDMLLDQAVVIIEWPENIQDALPAERLWITLALIENGQRHIEVSASGTRYQQLCAWFRDSVSQL